jgi:hypothetical protein
LQHTPQTQAGQGFAGISPKLSTTSFTDLRHNCTGLQSVFLFGKNNSILGLLAKLYAEKMPFKPVWVELPLNWAPR